MQVTKAKNGNRALLVYLFNATGAEPSDLNQAIEAALGSLEVGEIELGGALHTAVADDSRVETSIESGGWKNGIRIGAASGDVLTSLYFYSAPVLPEPPVVEGAEGAFTGNAEDDSAAPVGRSPENSSEDVELEAEPELEPEPPSIPQVVCDALSRVFDGATFGASAYVIRDGMEEFNFHLDAKVDAEEEL